MKRRTMENTFKTLYAMSSKGKVKQWGIEVINNGDGTSTIRKKSGYHNQIITENDKIIREGKNIGRANETTSHTQALAEAIAAWILRKDQNFIETIPDKNTELKIQRPMLVHKFLDRKKYIKYPCYGQIKANGTRNTAIYKNSKVQQIKRGGKPWKYFSHLEKYIKEFMPPNHKFDGEAFNLKYTFQQITNMVSKDKPENKEIQFWLFDIITPEPMDFKDRLKLLHSLVPDHHPFLIKIPTIILDNEKELMKFYEDVIEGRFDGHKHEGIVIRNMEGAYVENQRNNNVQKLKPLKTGEFKIVGGKSDKGIREGCCTFICETKSGEFTFSTTPKGTIDEKKEYLINIQNYIGKYLMCEFEDYSEAGKPLKVIGLGIREVDGKGEPTE